MTEQPSGPEQRFNVRLPPEVAAGAYAGFAQVWWDADVFTIDFASMIQQPTMSVDEESGRQVVVTQAQVVARVRIPPSQVWELARVLAQQLSQWEEATGRSASPDGA